MNTENRIRKSLTKGDILLVIGVVAVCFLWFVSSFAGESENLKLVIYKDGEAAESIDLSTLSEGKTFQVGGCEIYADSGGVKFVSSQCDDGLCVKRGTMTRAGDTMACVPEKVVVRLYGTAPVDIVAY